MKILARLLILCLPAGAAAADDNLPSPDPLFRGHEVLDVRLAIPLTTLMRERPDDDELPGTFSWAGDDGEMSVAVDVRTRGNFRRDRDVCPFAPIRLDFRKSEVEGTLLDGQDKLKMVTHCRNGSKREEQSLLKEYLVYRMLNALTERSFNVRLLRVTYVDTERDGKAQEEYAFLIEDDERLGKRQGLEATEIERTKVEALDPAFTNLVSLFAYFSGNTDFSPIAGPPGDECCHNVELFDGGGHLYPIPYDFDMTGIVDASYAKPNPRFGIRNVRTRLYRGRCVNNDHLPESIALFEARKLAIYTLIDMQPGLTDRYKERTRRFIDEFYEIIADEGEVRDELVGECI